MAYSLQIEKSEPITVNELLTAAKTIDSLRIDKNDSVATNPATKQEIRIPGAKTDISLWFSESEKWIKVFYFRRGRISFKADDWDDVNSSIREIAFELAEKLNAEIIGDGGENY